ncbi:MAG: DJ-1/PfpI family protein [Candidatus Altiarchaeota archaeon]|nr:DJ-1/PfpI family protein [Candidatus Altiarchaeota archaeon]
MKALIVLAPANFRDEELFTPLEILKGAGVSVTVAGLSMDESMGMLGGKMKPDILIDEVDAEDYDAIVIPGGSGAREYLAGDERVLDPVRDAFSKDKVVASICSAGCVLANSGILEGKKATVFPSPENVKVLKNKGAYYLEESIVVDGNIITAQGPKDAKNFAEKIVDILKRKA